MTNGLSVRQWLDIFRHVLTIFGILAASYGWFEPEADRNWLHIFLSIFGLCIVAVSVAWGAVANGLAPTLFSVADMDIVREVALDRRNPQSSDLAKLTPKITLR